MSVVDLGSRLTNKWDEFNNHKESSDSLIYLSQKELSGENISPTAIDLFVGDECFNPRNGSFFRIHEDGLKIPARGCLIVRTEQKVSLPYNVFGVVTGKGNFIFQGIFISPGKVNPGFSDNLKIGVYNGSGTGILIKKNEPFATCYFVNMEANLPHPFEFYQLSPTAKEVKYNLSALILGWFRGNYFQLLTWLTALAAIIVSLVK